MFCLTFIKNYWIFIALIFSQYEGIANVHETLSCSLAIRLKYKNRKLEGHRAHLPQTTKKQSCSQTPYIFSQSTTKHLIIDEGLYHKSFREIC